MKVLEDREQMTAARIAIRPAVAADAPSIAEVLREAFAEFEPLYTPEALAATTPASRTIEERMPEGPVWVALDGRSIVGTVAAVPQGHERSGGRVYVRSMEVLPSARGGGIAKLLMCHVESYARSAGARYLLLSTTPFLAGAIGLYERCGFRRSEDGPHDLFGTPLFTMVKSLIEEDKAGTVRMADEWTRGEYIISTDHGRVDLDTVHDYLANSSYWARDIPREVVERAVEHSMVFGVYRGSEQMGLARVITDYATFAYIADVFILEPHQGQGLGVWLMDTIVSHPDLQGFRKWSLATRDAHGLYRKVGFTELENSERWMVKRGITSYTQASEARTPTENDIEHEVTA